MEGTLATVAVVLGLAIAAAVFAVARRGLRRKRTRKHIP